VYALAIPNDGRQTEYLVGDGIHAHINVTEWRAPKLGKSASCRVIDYLQRPTKLSNDVGVGQRGHIRMSPGMHCDIILIGLEGGVEFVPIPDNI
jgi:hypothetical protein